MFESVVTTVLNKFLGDYVANMEGKQLNLGIFSGNVVLTDLRLKKEALDKLDLPIEVFYGHLGRLELHIPWRNLKSQPVSVVVEDLFLLAGPRVETAFDEAAELERAQKAKQEMLDTAELFANSMDTKLDDSIDQASFTEQLVAKIVDNLQVTVKNIHIRYEDSTSNKERLFSVGVSLKSLTAVSTDENWQETFIVNPQDAVNKLAKLNSLAVYWNTREKSMQALSFDEFVAECRARIGDDSHAYIIKPVSGVGKVIMNKKFIPGKAKTLLTVVFDTLGINVNYEQYYDLLSTLASISSAQRAMPYRKYRPTGAQVAPKSMFQYAIKCCLADIHERNRRRAWSYVLQHRADRKEYVNLYSNKLLLGELTGEDLKRLTELENRIGYDDLLHYRSLGRAFAKKSQASSPKGTASWFWGWLGYKNAADSNLVKEEDMHELYETIDYHAVVSGEGPESMPPETKVIEVDFELQKGFVSLSESPTAMEPMVALFFNELNAKFVKRPKTVAFDLALADLSLVENLVPESYFSELIKVKKPKAQEFFITEEGDRPFYTGEDDNSNSDSNPKAIASDLNAEKHPGQIADKIKDSLLKVSFDQMAENPDADAQVRISMKPLLVTINTLAIFRLIDFLLNSNTKGLLEAVKAEVQRTIDVIGTKTRANLQKALEEHKGTDLKIDIDAPIILIPEDPTDLSKAVFVVDLGLLKVDTILVSLQEKENIHNKKRVLTDEEMAELHELLYDKIRVNLSKVGVYFSESITGWTELSTSERDIPKANKIIDEIDINLLVENSIIPMAPNIAATKVTGNLPELVAYMSDLKLGKLMAILNSIPKSEDAEGGDKGQGTRPENHKVKRTPPLKTTKKLEGSSDDEFFDAVDDTKSSSTALAQEEVDQLTLRVMFNIGKVTLCMCKARRSGEEVTRISSYISNMMFGMTTFNTMNLIEFTLGNFGVMEHFSDPAGAYVVDGANFTSDTNLLTVDVLLVDPTNAEFSSVYGEVERSVSIELSSIQVLLSPKSVYDMVEFGLVDILPALSANADQKAAAPKPMTTTDKTAIEDLLNAYQPKTMLKFNFAAFAVILAEHAKTILKFHADTLDISLLMTGKRLELNGKMSAMQLLGYDANAEPVRLVYFEGDSVAAFSFETECAASEVHKAGNNIAKFVSGSLKVAVEPDCLESIAELMPKFLEIAVMAQKATLDQAADEQAPVAMEGKAAKPPDSQVITYVSLDVNSPILYIPSRDHQRSLSVYLGRLNVINTMEAYSIEGNDQGGFDQLFNIELSDINISLTFDEVQRTLLKHFTIPLVIRLSRDGKLRNFADVEVDGKVSEILAEISEVDFGNLMFIANDFIAAIPKITKLVSGSGDEQRQFDSMAELKKMNTIRKKKSSKAPSVVLATQVEAGFPLDTQVRVDAIRMRLKDPFDKEKVELVISGINITVISHTLDGMSVEVYVEGIRVTDVSDPALFYKDLVKIGGGMEEAKVNVKEGDNEGGEEEEKDGAPAALVNSKKQMVFRMEQPIEGPAKIDIYIESPRVYMLFDTIFYLQKFVLGNMPPKAKATTEEAAKTLKRAKSRMSVVEPIKEEEPYQKVNFNLLDACVIIVNDRTNEVTEALSLKVGSVSLSVDEKMVASVDDVNSYIYSTGALEKTKITIIDYLSVAAKMAKNVETNESLLEIKINPVMLTLSFQDLQFLQAIQANIFSAQAKNRILPPSSASSVSLASNLSEKETDSMEAPGNNNGSSSGMIEKGSILLEYIRVILIDDSTTSMVPLMDVNVDKISIGLADWSDQLSVAFTATVSCQCYNPALSYWEPLIEPWQFYIQMGPNELEPKSKSTIYLSAEKGLELLAVHHSIERILQMLQKLSTVSERSNISLRKIADPYCFGNYLGMRVEISDPAGTARNVSISSQSMSSFAFGDWRQLRSIFDMDHKVDLELDGGSLKSIKGVPVDRDGYYLYKTKKVAAIREEADRGEAAGEEAAGEEADGEEFTFIMHFFLEEGIRHIHLRYEIMIHNKTDTSMVLTFAGEDSGKSKSVDAGGKVCVPPIFENATCSVCPIKDGVQLDPIIDAFVPGDRFKLNGRVIKSKFNNNNGGRPQHMLLVCESLVLEGVADILLVAPLLLENLLPSNIEVRFIQGDYKSIQQVAEGESMQVYDIDPSRPCVVAISIPEIGLFSTNECEVVQAKEFTELTLQNEDGLELKVSLNRSALPNTVLKLSFSAYYLLVNQTNLTLQVQSEVFFKNKRAISQVFSIPPGEDGRPMAMFSHPNTKSNKNRVRIRAEDSNWSDPFSFDAVGAEIEICCKSMLTSKWYNLGGYVGLGSGRFAVTKIIYISARYYMVNNTDMDITVTDSEATYKVPAQEQIPIHFNPANGESIMMKTAQVDQWSAAFDIKSTGKLYIRDGDSKRLVRIGRSIRSPSLFVTLSFTDAWPYQIINQCSLPVSLKQRNTDKVRVCEPKSTMNYSWDQPCFREKSMIFTVADKDCSLDLSEVGRKICVKYKTEKDVSKYVDFEIRARGPAIVLLITNRDEGRIEEQEARSFSEELSSVILVKIPHVAVSLIGSDMKEFLLVYVRGVEVRYAISEEFISYGVTIKWMQIDNQSFDWEHPMLLYPAVISKSQEELEQHPFLSLGIIQAKDRSYGLTYFKYLGLLMQEVSIEMGEDMLHKIIDFANLSFLIIHHDKIIRHQDCVVPRFEVEKDSSDVLFFEFFQMHPMKVNLTFTRAEESEEQQKSRGANYNPMATVIDVLTMTLGNVSDAPLKFNALVLENVLSRQSAIQETVLEHYKSDALAQIHMVLGSADFLGNPVGLFTTLGSGVTDLFYEPYQGFVSDRPQDIGIGFARGGISLVKKTVSGLTGTLSKFTGSLAKGLSAATMDRSFQHKRRIDRAKNKPKHALSGVSTGVQQLYTGVKSGITGVIDKPLEGAKQGGVGGFFKGVGIGIVGVVTKPVVGLIDMTTSLTEGIKSSADDSANTVSQVRFPRVVPHDKKIRPYDAREAFGQSVLVGAHGVNKALDEYYVAHLEVPGDDSIVVLTTSHLGYISVNSLKFIWEINDVDIVGVKVMSDSVLVVTGGEKPRTKVIPINDPPSQEWFAEQILALLKK